MLLGLLLAVCASAIEFSTIAPGVELGSAVATEPSIFGDSVISIVRIDPRLLDVRLLEAKGAGGASHTARQWADQSGAIAVINAGMFEADGVTSTGFMKSPSITNNPAWKASYNDVLLLGPLSADVPPARIVDRTCEPWETIVPNYAIAIQSLRMLGCEGENTWGRTTKRWSAAAFGVDKAGRLLLIHVRSPYTMRQLVDFLRALPLDLVDLQYAEGGPEAQLFLRVGGIEREWIGSYETGFTEHDDNRRAWPIPNVIAVFAP